MRRISAAALLLAGVLCLAGCSEAAAEKEEPAGQETEEVQNEEPVAQDEKKPVEEEETEETESEKYSREKLEAAGWTKVRCKAVCGFLEFYIPPWESREGELQESREEPGVYILSCNDYLNESEPLQARKEWYHLFRGVQPEIADPEDYEMEYQDSEDFPDHWTTDFTWCIIRTTPNLAAADAREYMERSDLMDIIDALAHIKVRAWDKQSVWDNQSIEDEVEPTKVLKTSEDYVMVDTSVDGREGVMLMVKDTPYYYEIAMVDTSYADWERDEFLEREFMDYYEDFKNTIKYITE